VSPESLVTSRVGNLCEVVRLSALCKDCHVHGNEPRPQESDAIVDAVLRASRVLVAIAARSVADAGEEVTLTHYRSLVVLGSRSRTSVTALAEAMAVTPPNASRLCSRRVMKGLVKGRTDRIDRRQGRIALTKSGRTLVDAVSARRRNEITSLVDAIPLETQRSVAWALAELAQVAGEVPEQDWGTGWDL
jgi:DNA-binding MarR family transcriptional regulator